MTRTPPLRAIQAFEVVGRCGSVKAAAEELSVSPGAVTQQMHQLEKFLGFRLVERHGRGIQLTNWGRLYLSKVTAAMAMLRDGAQELERARQSNHLAVSALPSLTNKWLGPLIFEWPLSSEVGILLDGVDPEPRLDTGEADFRISYGARRRAHQRYSHLFTDFLIPVASPALHSGRPPPSDSRALLKFPLLWIDWGAEFSGTPTWRDWFVTANVAVDRVRCDLTFSLSSAAIDAAAEGRGLVLAQHSMVASALRRGSLIRLSERYLPLPESYFLAWSATVLDKPLGGEFRNWLTAQARRFEAPSALVSADASPPGPVRE